MSFMIQSYKHIQFKIFMFTHTSMMMLLFSLLLFIIIIAIGAIFITQLVDTFTCRIKSFTTVGIARYFKQRTSRYS
jgi:hypothetical protein